MPSKRNEVKREGEIDILINFLFLYPARLIARLDINFVAFYSFASCNISTNIINDNVSAVIKNHFAKLSGLTTLVY